MFASDRTPPLPEHEYVEYLEYERHMYAWCLRVYGERSADDALREAAEFYAYAPPSERYRWLVFHDMAWHWAMLRIHGEHYWLGRPELGQPDPEYLRESASYEATRVGADRK